MQANITLTDGTATEVSETASGGPIYIQASGDFGGGALEVHVSYDRGTNYDTLVTIAGTDDNFQNFELPAGAKLELQLVGATAPSVKVMIR